MNTTLFRLVTAVAALVGGAAAQTQPVAAPAAVPAPAAVTATATTLSATASAPLQQKRVLTHQGARRIVAAAIAAAQRLHAPGAAIAVSDDGGNLIALDRLDGTFAMASTVSTGKARTAALFNKPTRAFEEIINKGRTAMAALPDFTPLMGGVPIVVDGQTVGAIGVSGAASALQDDEIAMAAAKTDLGSDGMACCTGVEPMPVTFLPKTQVDAAFQQGMPLLEVRDFKIHASRRETAGRAEVHGDETDVIYVLSGRATFVTGGAVRNGETVAPHEIRGDSIAGGQTQQLQPGDVCVVPRGVPHWFQQVDAPLLYYVVKVVHATPGE